MKLSIQLILGVFLFASFSTWAQEPEALNIEALENVLDYESSLSDFQTAIQNNTEISTDRFYLLSGTLTAITVFDPEPETFYAEGVFQNAEWMHDEIASYKAVFVFIDPQFSSRIPQRTPRQVEPDMIVANTRGIAICEFYDIWEENGELMPRFIVHIYNNLD